jgi:hypothetical protein
MTWKLPGQLDRTKQARRARKPRRGRVRLEVEGLEKRWLPSSGAILTNGTLQLGVNPEGHLNVPGGTPSSETGTTLLGLRYLPTNAECLSIADPAEGWGVADATSRVSGYADLGTDGVVNLSLVSFTATASTAVSVVDIGSTFRITQDYHPAAASPDLYEDTVTIENLSAAPVQLRYRRVMDWDAEPTAFHEFVTVHNGVPGLVLDDNNDGFATANPLGSTTSGRVSPLYTGNFDTVGPADQGALFDFNLGALGAHASVRFLIYYGAATSRAEALAALSAAGAEGYSLAQPSSPGGQTQGTPNTFMVGFARYVANSSGWVASGQQPIADPGQSTDVTLGTAALSPQTGDLHVEHDLDFRRSMPT